MANGKKERDPRVEALRLVAAASIAIFHTFMPWFSAMTGGYGTGPGDGIIDNPIAAPLLGFINLLGSFGNNVFFCISGLFLIPAAVAAAKETGNGPDCPGYWRAQAQKAARRAAPLLATIAFYVVAVLAVSAFVVPIEDATPENLPGLLGGLEFIWVYLVLMVLAPAIGWAKARLEQKPAAWRAPVAAFVVAVFAVNAYIAFVDQGDADRGLGDWRKLMSAVTYLAAFVVGGEVSSVRLGRRAAGALLVATVAASLGVETALAHARELDLMAATSFKSTSALAFCTAVAAVLFARSCTGRERAKRPLDAPVCRAAKSVLGFYILQSLTMPLWLGELYGWLVSLYKIPWFTSVHLIGVGTAASLLLLALMLAIDQVVRLPLFRRLGLAR